MKTWLRRLGEAAVVFIVASGALARADDANAVALPPFLVEEVAKGPPWRYGEAMGYEILSRCSDRVTRNVVEAHQRLHVLLDEILPAELRLTLSFPRTLVIYDDELQPAASREVIDRMLKATDAEPPEPVDFGRRGARLALPPGRHYTFLPNLRLWDADSMAVFMIVRREDFRADQLKLTHDYISFLVKRRLPALPVWFTTGLLALHENIEYRGDRLELPPLVWLSSEQTELLKKLPPAAPVPVQPLADFFPRRLTTREDARGVDPLAQWQAQAALFVRWALEADDGTHRAGLFEFAARTAVEGTSERLFAECFGFDYAAAQARLGAYLPAAIRREASFRPRMPKFPPLALRNATPGEIARLKGDWERLEVPFVKAISPELAAKYLEQARRTLRRGYDHGERDARLLAVLGLCELEAGETTAARDYLEAAFRGGRIRPRAACELARLRFADACATPAAADGRRIDVAQTASVLAPLFAARKELPPLPEVYGLIADAWARSSARPTRGHLAVLDEGVRLFPRDLSLVLRAAELNATHGYIAEAQALLDIAGRTATDDDARARVSSLQAQLRK